ncbi:glycerol-3-phosphate responsive antiterminator [Oceanobacillus picturae]|uniref:Glycerol uptake operon antiterminator regulatory protein n=1 Tax=Oceanobacillus picturae TaxID=171693 RepID=A0A0U9H9Z2_9BACI|nr:glycerol-3-phosphate responsive antiterminator [Oceanobacillus picturae]RIU94839.1 glycerol-3-phosphate responsive antiterminator [Oceanobacillus picturae]GAQ16948.1 glycerol-3-phosphate responsive antiterminator [Oceanobacillus picturae]
MPKITNMVQSQVIASIKKEKDIEKAIKAEADITFLLTGNLINTKDYIDRLRHAGKKVFVHIDFIEGISNTPSAIQYIAQKWRPTGIITTKSNLIKYANEEGLLTIQRIFLIDHSGMKKGIDIAHKCKPHAIEVLPGLMPNIIDNLTKQTRLPIIAGGLISNKNEILQGLRAGALAISTGDPKLWNLGL